MLAIPVGIAGRTVSRNSKCPIETISAVCFRGPVQVRENDSIGIVADKMHGGNARIDGEIQNKKKTFFFFTFLDKEQNQPKINWTKNIKYRLVMVPPSSPHRKLHGRRAAHLDGAAVDRAHRLPRRVDEVLHRVRAVKDAVVGDGAESAERGIGAWWGGAGRGGAGVQQAKDETTSEAEKKRKVIILQVVHGTTQNKYRLILSIQCFAL